MGGTLSPGDWVVVTLKNGDMLEGVVFENGDESGGYGVFFPSLNVYSGKDYFDFFSSQLKNVFNDFIDVRYLGGNYGDDQNLEHYGLTSTGDNRYVFLEKEDLDWLDVGYYINKVYLMCTEYTDYAWWGELSSPLVFHTLDGKDITISDYGQDELKNKSNLYAVFYGSEDNIRNDIKMLKSASLCDKGLLSDASLYTGSWLMIGELVAYNDYGHTLGFHGINLGLCNGDGVYENAKYLSFDARNCLLLDNTGMVLSGEEREEPSRKEILTCVVKLKLDDSNLIGNGTWENPYIIH